MFSSSSNAHRRTKTFRRRPNGLGQLGFCPAAGCVALAAGTGPVGIAITIGISVVGLYMTFKDWFERGQLKIAATAKAEDFVQSIWGTTQPNSPPQTDSVSKLIEDCRLDEALQMIQFLARQMTEKAKDDPYFERWVKEWGAATLQSIEAKLFAYRGYCAVVEPPPSEPPPVQCPANFQLVNGVCKPLSCPSGFYLKGSVCAPLSPPEMPPVIDNSGNYVPIASSGSSSMLWLLLAAGAVLVASR